MKSGMARGLSDYVARNVWLPILVWIPAAAAARRIILDTSGDVG